jgi:hypothetical protein
MIPEVDGAFGVESRHAFLPRCVLFRDSFGDRLWPFLNAHFSYMTVATSKYFDPDVVERTRLSVVIQELVEYDLWTWKPDPEREGLLPAPETTGSSGTSR